MCPITRVGWACSLLTWIKRLLPLPGATKMPEARNPVGIEYGYMIRTIKSLEKLLKSTQIHESTRRHAKEVKESLEKQVAVLHVPQGKK